MSKFTRRELAALSMSTVLLARAQGQTQPQAAAANPDEDLKAWQAQLRATAGALDAFPLPMATEPATKFKP